MTGFIMCGSGTPDMKKIENAMAGLFDGKNDVGRFIDHDAKSDIKEDDPRLRDYKTLGGLAYEDLRLDFQRRTKMLFKIKRQLLRQSKQDWLDFKAGWNEAKRRAT